MSGEVPDWLNLTEGEDIIWRDGPARVRIVQELGTEIVLIAIGLGLLVVQPESLVGIDLTTLPFLPFGLTEVGLVILVLGLLSVLATYLRFRSIEYVITSKELYHKRGLVSRSVKNLQLEQVQDTGFTQSALQRLFDYGTVYASTAGGDNVELRFKNVEDPAGVNGVISEQLT